MRWHRYLQTSGDDEAKLTWKLYWQLKVSQISYFWPIFPKWAVAQLVKGWHREHLNHRFAGSNPDTAELRLAHIFIFFLPSKCWFVKSLKFSDFSRRYFFSKKIISSKNSSLFEAMTQTDCLQIWKVNKKFHSVVKCFTRLFVREILKFKFNVKKATNKIFNWIFGIDWC